MHFCKIFIIKILFPSLSYLTQKLHFQILEKWQNSPVLVSFDSSVTPISTIPFPAVTICNMNKVQKSRHEYVEEKRAAEPDNDYWQKEHLFEEEVCASHLEGAREILL